MFGENRIRQFIKFIIGRLPFIDESLSNCFRKDSNQDALAS